VPPAVTVVPVMPITAVIIVTAAVHIRIPTIRPAAVVDSHVSCSVRSGGSDRTQKGEKKRSEQYQLQQTVLGVKPIPQRIGTAYPVTRFAVAHLHILDKGPSHVQKQTHKARWMNRYPRCLGSPQKKLTSDFERPQSQSSWSCIIPNLALRIPFCEFIRHACGKVKRSCS
jgi:hypothetical protein